MLEIDPEQLPFRAGCRPHWPVDVEAIALYLGARVFRSRSQPAWSSALDRRAGDVRIWVRREDQVVYQRFSIAHLVGHLMLPGHDALLYRETDYTVDAATPATVARYGLPPCPREAEANQFALRLLMPEGSMRLYVSQNGMAGLPEAFQVSERAAKTRLRQLGLYHPAPGPDVAA